MAGRARGLPLFRFGVIADVQYADIDDGFNYTRTRQRYYRSSLQLLRRAVTRWDAEGKPDFVLQLGDLIDGFNKRDDASQRALDAVLEEFRRVEVHHVWGNHEFYNFSRSALLRSGLNSKEHRLGRAPETGGGPPEAPEGRYAYCFSPAPGFSFVVLDAYDVSLLGRDEASEEYSDAMRLIRQHNHNQDLNCPPGTHLCGGVRCVEGSVSSGPLQRFTMFNGGFSKEQLDWLDSVLASADEKQERVTLVSHLPVHPYATGAICLAWNFDELLAIIRTHSSVVCFMAGHDHDGGYHQDQDTGVHHVTLEGVIETPPDSDAFGTVSVYEDRMVLEGSGRIADRVFLFPSHSIPSDTDPTAT